MTPNGFRAFITGYSGVGKSVAVNAIGEFLDLPIKGGVIRRDPSLPQAAYSQAYIDIHISPGPYICERSVLDVLAWTKDYRGVMYLVGSKVPPPSVIVIPPLPTEAHIRSHLSVWTGDPVRRIAFVRRWEEDPSMSDDAFASRLAAQFISDYAFIAVAASEIGWPLVHARSANGDYFSWQLDANAIVADFYRRSSNGQ